MTSDPTLRRLYRKQNLLWFGGQLPDDVVVFYEPTANAAETFELDEEALAIRFDTSLLGMKRYTALLMAHEQIHVLQWSKRRLAHHGAAFDAEIQRLCTFKSYRKLL